MKVSVVIPYYQRAPGILRRALESVFAQVLPADVSVDVILVDDASPSPPDIEIAGLSRPGFSIQIVRRPNGGPARARNTGLDEVGQTDWVAFLDSDDTWMENHLATALRALQTGARFYCANNLYEGDRTWFGGLPFMVDMLAAARWLEPGLFQLDRKAAMRFFLEGCVAHTSTVLVDARLARGIRFEEDQEMAGEDYLFWISAVDRADRIAFSTDLMAARGRGVDIYRGALDWNNPECVRRLYFALLLHKKILHRFCRTPDQKRTLQGKIGLLRRGIAYLFLRNALRHAKVHSWVMKRLASEDLTGLARLPANMLITAWQKASGRLEFPVG